MQRYALSRRCQACGYETDWLGVEIGSRIPNKPDAAVCKGRNPVWVRVPPQPLEIILARKQEALRQHNVLMERLLSVLPPRKDEDK